MNQCRFCINVLVAIVLLSPNSFAETSPPRFPSEDITWKPSMKKKPSESLRMGSFRVEFEKTTLGDVQRAITKGHIAHQGTDGGSLYWLCYTNVEATRVERVWITSDGEMGGDNHEISGVIAELLLKGKETKDCPALPSNMKPLLLDSDIWINTSVNEVHDRLGNPSYQKESWESFFYQGKVKGSGGCGEEGYDQVNDLSIKITDGRVKSLRMWQVTSC